jgi:multiple sugar transport system permease protein
VNFLLGTILTWAGIGAGVLLIWRIAEAVLGRDYSPSRWMSPLLTMIAGLGVGALLLPEPGWRLPLVWVVMPTYGWAATFALSTAAVRIVLWLVRGDGTSASIHTTILWAVAGALFCWLAVRSGAGAEILRGSVPISGALAVSFVGLLLLAVVSMALAGRYARARGYARALALHAVLITGSVVFSLPLAFLLVTSFKEDRDMVSPEGIIWIPKVTQEAPYYDPVNPLYEGEYQGQTVEAEAIETLANGKLRLDIFRPMALRGATFEADRKDLKVVPRSVPMVSATFDGQKVEGMVVDNKGNGIQVIQITSPPQVRGRVFETIISETEPIRKPGLRWKNYTEALEFLPPETNHGLVYLQNTLLLVVLNVVGTLLSSSIVAYAFSRMRFPGKQALFGILLATMMLPGAVTLLPQFLIFRYLGWIDTLTPLWAPAFFASAFNVFLLRQFFLTIPMELEDAAKIDGSGYLGTFWRVMLPQIKPALAVIAIWTFIGAWNNFMGPLIYINSPEKMPISYATQLFVGERSGEPGLLMAFTTLSMLPVLLVFFFAQRYFIEGVTLSGLGGR